MTEKEKQAYNERGEKRVKNGKVMQWLGSSQTTARRLEDALREDAKEWQKDFFSQFMGTPELQAYYNGSKENKKFLHALFHNAFMYGGCYLMRAIEAYNIEQTHNYRPTAEEVEAFRKEMERVNREIEENRKKQQGN